MTTLMRGEELKPGFKKKRFNSDQRKKKRKNNIVGKNRSGARRHIHGIDSCVKSIAVHRSGYFGVVV